MLRDDVNCDGKVTAADLVALALLIPTAAPGACGHGDVNRDGVVNTDDIDALIEAILSQPTSER